MHTGHTSSGRRRALLASIAAVVGNAASAQSQQAGAASEPIRIGVIAPLSGGSGTLGDSLRRGVRIGVEEFNFMGGLLGRPIELIERDDQANAETGKKIAAELIQKKVIAAIGVVNTAVGNAVIDTFQQASTPLFIAGSIAPGLTRKFAPPAARENFIFRVSPTVDLEATVLIEDLKRRGIQRFAVIADTTPYGDLVLKSLERYAEKNAITVASVTRFAVGDTDMSNQIRQARAAQSEAVVLGGIGAELVAIAKGIRAAKWPVPILGGWTLAAGNFIDGAGPAAEGALTTQTFIQQASTGDRNQFLLAWERTFKESRIPSPMTAAQGHDALTLLAFAVLQAESAQGAAIKSALENLQKPVRGVITTYDKPFSATDHDAITANMLIVGKVEAGRVVYAHREDANRSFLARRKQS